MKNFTPAEDSTTTHEVIIGKSNTYQHPLLIVAGSLLVLLVWIAVTGKSGGQHFKSSVQEIPEGGGALADYQADTANFSLAKDICSVNTV